jgi:hypothetical protein
MQTIKANKCVVGETYFLDGGWYDYNFENFKHQPLINTPVKFLGISNKTNNIGKHWLDRKGKHIFERLDGRVINTSSTDTMLLTPIIDPEILR